MEPNPYEAPTTPTAEKRRRRWLALSWESKALLAVIFVGMVGEAVHQTTWWPARIAAIVMAACILAYGVIRLVV